ncbi:MAG: hypothetical protein FJW35_05085 [Acidobacteria bacterium]|nr:hypothetical protein [Acidobacteriota bacterium]
MRRKILWLPAFACAAVLAGALPAEAGGFRFSFGFSFGSGGGHYHPHGYYGYRPMVRAYIPAVRAYAPYRTVTVVRQHHPYRVYRTYRPAPEPRGKAYGHYVPRRYTRDVRVYP